MSKIELNRFERGLSQLSPSWAVKRAAARMALDVMAKPDEKKRRYEAGRPNRATAGWNATRNASANSEIRYDLSWLRDRSRDLVRNNPYAKKAVQVITTNVIGTGIRPSIAKGSMPKAHERKLMNAWRTWAETKQCDYNGQFNFYGLMMQAWRGSVESGDSFIRVIRDPKSKVPIKLLLLEADYCDDSRDGTILPNGNYILLGIEFDGKTNKRVAYWMFQNHPNDIVPIRGNLMSVRIPAEEIIHIYEVLRPGQIRGVPHGVSSFIRIKNLDEYEDAQLVRQKIASCFSVFIKKNDPEFLDFYPEAKEVDEKIPALGEKIAPGIMEYLAPGEEVQFANPPGTTGYEPYTRSNLRAISTAYLITYEALANDLSGVNFSSGRMGWLEMHRQVSQWQEFTVIPMYCQEVWDHFLFAINLSGVYTGDQVAAEWTPPRREMIDPVKEAHGMQMQIRAGIASRSDIVRQMGGDPEKVLAEIISEQLEQDSAGLMLDSDGKWDAARVNFGKDAYILTKVKPDSKTAQKK